MGENFIFQDQATVFIATRLLHGPGFNSHPLRNHQFAYARSTRLIGDFQIES